MQNRRGQYDIFLVTLGVHTRMLGLHTRMNHTSQVVDLARACVSSQGVSDWLIVKETLC